MIVLPAENLEESLAIYVINHKKISTGVFTWLMNTFKVIGVRKPKYEKSDVVT
jgi:hypothetical protein